MLPYLNGVKSLPMQTSINLWLWKYKNPGRHGDGYHLRADEVACDQILARLSAPDFAKISYSLRPVPEAMTRILTVSDPRFMGFERMRIFLDIEQTEALQFSEINDQLDLRLNRAGIVDLSYGLNAMRDGQWDFSVNRLWFWGLLSDEEYHKRYDRL